MKYLINSKNEYHETMVAIYKLMNKNEVNMTSSEIKKLAAMAAAAEKYEDEVLEIKPAKPPETIFIGNCVEFLSVKIIFMNN